MRQNRPVRPDPRLWCRISNESDVRSPALLLYPDRIRENIARMIAIAGHPARLRPHVKTHKLREVVQMQIDAGIERFKCATLAELETCLDAGARDVLLAYPLVGPTADAFVDLVRRYPDRRLSGLVDDMRQVAPLAGAARRAGVRRAGSRVELFVDIDNGMHRTGAPAGDPAFELYEQINAAPELCTAGLHVYDGHLHESDRAAREAACRDAFAPVAALARRITAAGMAIPELLCGGTPTFPVHAAHEGRTLCPGTTLLWDDGYSSAFPDLDFLLAAVVLARVVSKPASDVATIDLGVKALSADKPHPRVALAGIAGYEVFHHSEEHLTIACPEATALEVGSVLYGVPRHICPTVALYDEALVVRDGAARERWLIEARSRRLASDRMSGRSG
ncbi:MAG: D-TA family PLP-dependent enzyme [Spirochaetota bacterium]